MSVITKAGAIIGINNPPSLTNYCMLNLASFSSLTIPLIYPAFVLNPLYSNLAAAIFYVPTFILSTFLSLL